MNNTAESNDILYKLCAGQSEQSRIIVVKFNNMDSA